MFIKQIGNISYYRDIDGNCASITENKRGVFLKIRCVSDGTILERRFKSKKNALLSWERFKTERFFDKNLE